jgi:hypothetical protein
MRRDLEKAEKAANEAMYFIGWKEAKVDRLKSKIEKAGLLKARIIQESDTRKRTADRLIEEATTARGGASAARDRRIARITRLCDDRINERKERLSADLAGYSSVGKLSVFEAANMEVRALGDLAALHAVELILCDVARVNNDLRKAAKQMPDYTWFRKNGGNRSLYDKLQASYCKQAGNCGSYDYCGRELAPLYRLRYAFAQSEDIEAQVRESLAPRVRLTKNWAEW